LNRLPYSSVVLLPLLLTACGNEVGFFSPFRQINAGNPPPSRAVVPALPTPIPIIVTAAQIPLSTSCDLPDFKQEMMHRINQVRAAGRVCGGTVRAAVAAVSWNAKLLTAASRHSTDMADKNFFSHSGSDGSSGGQRITNAGYTWRMWAENIAAGQMSVDQVMQAWLVSPSHCDAIMNGVAVEVGVACVRNEADTYKYYWTMEFGAPR
jgi:uncharacterized protein YkwD